jgi:hypothetical protein
MEKDLLLTLSKSSLPSHPKLYVPRTSLRWNPTVGQQARWAAAAGGGGGTRRGGLARDATSPGRTGRGPTHPAACYPRRRSEPLAEAPLPRASRRPPSHCPAPYRRVSRPPLAAGWPRRRSEPLVEPSLPHARRGPIWPPLCTGLRCPVLPPPRTSAPLARRPSPRAAVIPGAQAVGRPVPPLAGAAGRDDGHGPWAGHGSSLAVQASSGRWGPLVRGS